MPTFVKTHIIFITNLNYITLRMSKMKTRKILGFFFYWFFNLAKMLTTFH